MEKPVMTQHQKKLFEEGKYTPYTYVKGGKFKEVTLEDFNMGVFTVTNALYYRVLGMECQGNPNEPKVDINWYDAVEFANKYSEKLGLTPAYNIDKENRDPMNTNSSDNIAWTVTIIEGSNGFRLPSVHEWEYAARSGYHGDSYTYAGSNNLDEVGWYASNSGGKVHNVGELAPNTLGIFDMSGNVWEWCFDWYEN